MMSVCTGRQALLTMAVFLAITIVLLYRLSDYKITSGFSSKISIKEQSILATKDVHTFQLAEGTPADGVGKAVLIPKKKTDSVHTLAKETPTPEKVTPFDRKFIYLIQTEECIPAYLASPDVLGDGEACHCELLVLSYKSKCLNNPLPHAKYIFNSSATWTTGRSLLYTTAISRQEQYLYYVFMDDDVQLFEKDGKSGINPWRWFESLLNRIEPPLAAADNPDWRLIDHVHERRQINCTLVPSTDEYFPAVWFDAIFNAMHYKAVRHIMGTVLPYWNKFDKKSWWLADWYVNIMTDMAFHGQAILLAKVMTSNNKHRPYPKGIHDAAVLKSVANDIRKLIPDKYRKATEGLLKRWETEYVDILTTVTDTYCKPLPPPKPDLVPFSWVEGV